jgi:excinuclease ABC subunit B
MDFQLETTYQPSPDQQHSISRLTEELHRDRKHQVLLGVTGSGKTFVMANVIRNCQRPTLVISHNKTLAAQLYQELRDFFPKNAVSYFVSYYDYYQPEAYLPQTDTYIEKETEINEEIDKLRLAATTNLLTRTDTIVIASVSCIYNLGSPVEYGKFILELRTGMTVEREQILLRLNDLQYDRSEFDFQRGSYRVRGDQIDLYPAYEDRGLRIILTGNKLTRMQWINPLDGEVKDETEATVIYPAKHYMTDPRGYQSVFDQIRQDTAQRTDWFRQRGKIVEAYRLQQKVSYDLEMISEIGYVNGIENYSRYFDGRKPGEPPYSLLEYFPKNYLMIVDESHITIPQIRGMYNGDRSRKEVLIDYGFRLPAALDNRPLNFTEFMQRANQVVYTSATPGEYELSLANDGGVTELLTRPTGIPDPEVSVRPVTDQVQDLTREIESRVARGERVLVTTLTKRMAEDLAEYLNDYQIKVHYLHADVETLDRVDILSDLRSGVYDVIVGVNLLREGLDLPEVSLVAVLDADKEGFLRSDVSLIQTMGRASRHVSGQVILYADVITGSMQRAIDEVGRRREYQLEYNRRWRVTPKTVEKPIREKLIERVEKVTPWQDIELKPLLQSWNEDKVVQLLPMERKKLVGRLRKEMKYAAENLEFETAALLRDKIKNLQAG